MLYFGRRQDLRACSLESKIDVVLSAAELGLCLDGRLAHAVPYKGQAALIVDYKGLISIARRAGLIEDVYADVICEGDECEFRRTGAEEVFVHGYDPRIDRGNVCGAYAMILFRGGRSRVVTMSLGELESIRARSRAGGSGPWMTDTAEMYKKTVTRRALKTYCDDPALSRAFDVDAGDELENDNPREIALAPVAFKVHELLERPIPSTEWITRIEMHIENGLTITTRPNSEGRRRSVSRSDRYECRPTRSRLDGEA